MFVILSKMKERKLKLTKKIMHPVKEDYVLVLSKQNVRKKTNHQKTLRISLRGMECGRCVAHLLVLLFFITMLLEGDAF